MQCAVLWQTPGYYFIAFTNIHKIIVQFHIKSVIWEEMVYVFKTIWDKLILVLNNKLFNHSSFRIFEAIFFLSHGMRLFSRIVGIKTYKNKFILIFQFSESYFNILLSSNLFSVLCIFTLILIHKVWSICLLPLNCFQNDV